MDEVLTRILKLIDENNTDQKDVATALGLKKQSISEWKAGRTKSYKKYIGQIADYFGVTTDYLLGNSPVRHGSMEIQSVNNERYIPIPAKGVGRETGARVQISQSAPNSKNPPRLNRRGYREGYISRLLPR